MYFNIESIYSYTHRLYAYLNLIYKDNNKIETQIPNFIMDILLVWKYANYRSL